MDDFSDFAYTVGIDIAKNVFQVYSLDRTTGEIANVQVKRADLLEYFRLKGKCLIGMEACGSSQYWAREMTDLGHVVRLMAPHRVKPYVSGQKSDKADAEGIHRSLINHVPAIAVRGGIERDLHSLMAMRSMLVKRETSLINHLRGLLLEYGKDIPKSKVKFYDMAPGAINELEGRVAQALIDEFRSAVDDIRHIKDRVTAITAEAVALAKQTKNAAYFTSIPGVGVITMCCLCFLLSDPAVYKSARQFAAFLGLAPKHTGTGGNTVITHIPARCNKELRALFVECAQSVARRKVKSAWVLSILKDKPKKVALIAIANRIARQCWAVASKSQFYREMPVAKLQAS